MLESLFETTATNALNIDIEEALICIFAALVLGIFISAVYIFSDRTKKISHHFAMTLVLLPPIVAVVIMLIGSNVARAISLGGVFALVRFRSVPGNSKDIVSIFFAMTVGLAAGMGYPVFAAMVTVIIGGAYFVLSLVSYKGGIGVKKQLRITVPENLNFEGAFDSLFAEYTKSCQLVRIKTTNLGSLYELTYDLVFKSGISQKQFLDDLRCRNGNLNILIYNAETEENIL